MDDFVRLLMSLSENIHLLRLSAFGGLPSSLVPPGRRPSGPEALRRTFLYASFLRISEALHMDIFYQPLEGWFFGRFNANRSSNPINERTEGGNHGSKRNTEMDHKITTKQPTIRGYVSCSE